MTDLPTKLSKYIKSRNLKYEEESSSIWLFSYYWYESWLFALKNCVDKHPKYNVVDISFLDEIFISRNFLS